MRLTLTYHEGGATSQDDEISVVYDIDHNEAHFGTAFVVAPALLWKLHEGAPVSDAMLSAEVTVDPAEEWILRCDRIDFPPGGVAHLHTHPGPGIRCQLFGELTVETEGRSRTYGPLGAWYETGPDPVFAIASETDESAFVRVMLLPRKWEGKRTITYVDPADADRPKLQRATVFFDRHVEL
jgi:quercetin dioxygenase-like cupin family protein